MRQRTLASILLGLSILILLPVILNQSQGIPFEQPLQPDLSSQPKSLTNTGNATRNISLPAPAALVTPIPDPEVLGGVQGRPLGVTLLGVSILCCCALVPLTIIIVAVWMILQAHNQRPSAPVPGATPGSPSPDQEA